jgi:hypothetical protein
MWSWTENLPEKKTVVSVFPAIVPEKGDDFVLLIMPPWLFLLFSIFQSGLFRMAALAHAWNGVGRTLGKLQFDLTPHLVGAAAVASCRN